MKVAFIGQKGIPAVSGGVERHVEELGSRLAALGVNVTVYCRSTYGECSNGVYKGMELRTIKTLDNKNLEALVYALRATMDALREDFDIIHYHSIGPASLSFIPHILKKKIIVTVHGLDWQREKWGRFAKTYLRFGELASGRCAGRIISVSEDLREYFAGKYKRLPGDVHYIPNGVTPVPERSPDEIRLYGLERDSYILFLARLVPEKGAHYLIKAYLKLKTGKKLVVAGGSSHTEDYVKYLKELAGEDERIIFTGNAEGALLLELYSNCCLYVLPSDIEGMPISLLEALSFGRCTLVSNIPQNEYVIGGGRYGFTFIRGDVDDLASKLSFLLDNPGAVNEKADISRQHVLNNFNWDKIALETLDVYKEYLNKK